MSDQYEMFENDEAVVNMENGAEKHEGLENSISKSLEKSFQTFQRSLLFALGMFLIVYLVEMTLTLYVVLQMDKYIHGLFDGDNKP